MLKHEQGAAVLTFAQLLIICFYWLQNMFKIKQQILSGTPLHLSYQCNRFDLICCFGVVPKEMKSKPCPVGFRRVIQEQKWQFLLIFHLDLHQIIGVSFQQLICANLNPTSCSPFRLSSLWGMDDQISEIFFCECCRAKFEIMVDHGSSRIVWLMLEDWAALQDSCFDRIFAKLYH